MKKAMIAMVLLSASVLSMAENKQERKLPTNFWAVEVTKGANVSLYQSDKNMMEVVTDGCPTSDVLTEVTDGVLLVKMKKKTPGSAVMVNVYFTGDIKSLLVRRGASLETGCLYQSQGKLMLEVGAQSEVSLDLDVNELEVSANTCHITLEGTAKKQNVQVYGAVGKSTYNAKSLKCEEVTIKAVSTDAVVNFTGKLKAEADGCTIRYKGDGPVDKTVRSGGAVEPF